MIKENSEFRKTYLLLSIAATLFYWYWETVASGNIRVDLIIIYPALFLLYLITLWNKFKFYSVPIAVFLMAVNFLLFLFSYDLFNKNPG